jgi:hypothetical protein
MKAFLICLVLLVVVCSMGFGQERQDVVYLKNGDIRKGTIIENAPNDYIKVETADGSIFTIKYSEIERITKEAKSASASQQSVRADDAQKLMVYESGKKSPALAVLLSCLLTSAGHAYADNWPRGLLFTLGRVSGAVLALTAGMETKTDRYGYETVELNGAYYAGLGIALGIAIWEMIDAAAEVDRYNARLYEKIMGKKPDWGVNIVPTREGPKLVLSYNF